MRSGTDGVQIDVHDAFGELGDERVATVDVFTLPTPAEAGEHVEGEPDVLKSGVARETFTFGHVSVENYHGCDVQRDGRGEKCDVGEADKLAVDDDYVVRCDDSCGSQSSISISLTISKPG